MTDLATPTEPARHSRHVQALREKARTLLEPADVRIDGKRAWDMRIHDERVFARAFAHGSLGLGEAYMDGWWEAGALDQFFTRVLDARVDEQVHDLDALRAHLRARFLNMQRGRRAYRIGKAHYDIGNELFAKMLGKRLVYSCGYWAHADNLDDAEAAKLDLVCRKLQLRPGMRVLDIGCGWGEALKFAAEKYGVSGVGVTVSEQQAEFARGLCKGLPIEIRVQDYRSVEESFDAVYSIGMFEHVGWKNYRTYFEVCRRTLKDGGLSLLHCIGTNGAPSRPDAWIEKYIFPNSMIPAASQVASALEDLFVIEDWHNFGTDYDRTLMAWLANFDAAWPELAAANSRYDERFRRMWRYYLCSSAASFRTRRDQLWQLTLSPRGVPGGYRVPR